MAAESQRTACIEARISREALKVVRRAAEIQGRSVSDFVVAAAQEAAQRAIADTEVLKLSSTAQEQFISHWAGIPLQDYPLILKLIGETVTTTGLTVNSHLITKHFPTGIKISDEQMRQLRLRKHRVLPQWNYTLLPRQNPN